jgi:hypothetical protein
VSERLGEIVEDGPASWHRLGSVRGVIRREEGAWQLTLELVDEGELQSRRIAAEACDDLAEAAAVAIALALDAAQQPGGGSGQASVEDDASGTAPAPSPRTLPLSTEFVAQALLDEGSLPALAWGMSGELRMQLSLTSLGLYGVLLPEQSDAVRADRFVDFSLWFVGARVCRSMFRARLEGTACVALDAGQLRAGASGLARARQVTDLWLAPSASLELGGGLWGRLGALARVEATFPLVRRPYVINDTEDVHRPSTIIPRVFAGLTWAL